MEVVEWRTERIEELNDALRRWAGAEVYVMQLTSSLRQMNIELWREGSPLRLLVNCISPVYYSGPLRWRSASLEVVPMPESERVPYKAEYELRDAGANVVVRCRSVRAYEAPVLHCQQNPT